MYCVVGFFLFLFGVVVIEFVGFWNVMCFNVVWCCM